MYMVSYFLIIIGSILLAIYPFQFSMTPITPTDMAFTKEKIFGILITAKHYWSVAWIMIIVGTLLQSFIPLNKYWYQLPI